MEQRNLLDVIRKYYIYEKHNHRIINVMLYFNVCTMRLNSSP